MYLIRGWVKAQEAFLKVFVSRNSLEVCNVQFLICLFKSPSTHE